MTELGLVKLSVMCYYVLYEDKGTSNMMPFLCGLQNHRLLVLKNNIEVGQFQSNSPRYLPISEVFWKALAKLPAVYDYAAYRQILEQFGTHYLAAGTLGGSFSVVAGIDEETQRYMSTRQHVLSVAFYTQIYSS